MSLFKQSKDYLIKFIFGKDYVPAGLFELTEYMNLYQGIEFEIHQEDGEYIAVSKNFKHGSIVTAGKNHKELDENIKDAILTSFEIPASFANEAKIINENGFYQRGYATV